MKEKNILMIKEIKKFCISINDASKGGIHNLPLVKIKEIKGFDTDKYFKHIGQNNVKASIDIILFTSKHKYFIEFKGGDYRNIDIENINDKIIFTMLKYFGDGDENISDSKKKNYFYLVVRGEDELYWGINMTAMQKYAEKSSRINLDDINKTIKKYEKFCYKKTEILPVGRFLKRINSLKNNEKFILNCD